MSEQEKFLTRWSRRKHEAEQEKAAPATAPGEAERTPLEDELAEVLRNRAQGAAESARDTAELPAVDLTKLPPLESITASTDIRPFLAVGVPDELRCAALRRAWVVDPAIRNFVGIAENQWDFTAPDGVPGFGPLLPIDDIRRLVAQVVGDAAEHDVPEAASASPLPPPQPAATTEEFAVEGAGDDVALLHETASRDDDAVPKASSRYCETEADVIVRDESNDAALQNNSDESTQNKFSPHRTHGSALPK